MINLTKAEEVLDDLKSQLKEAQDRVVLLLGAIQGAEAIINSLKEDEAIEDVPLEEKSIISKKRVNKNAENSA